MYHQLTIHIFIVFLDIFWCAQITVIHILATKQHLIFTLGRHINLAYYLCYVHNTTLNTLKSPLIIILDLYSMLVINFNLIFLCPQLKQYRIALLGMTALLFVPI